MKKKSKALVVCAMYLCLCFSVFAQDVYEQEDEWILAATEFTFKEETESSDLLDQVASILPQLILSEFESSPERLIDSKEMLEKVEYNFNLQQNDLYDSLSTQVANRDKTLFELAESKAAKQLESNVLEYTKEIEDIKELLGDLQEERDEERTLTLEKKSYTSPVSLWNEQIDLYEVSTENPYADGISAIISGSLGVRGEYITVNAELTLYPSREVVFQFSDGGTFQDVSTIAQNIAKHFFPYVLNSKTATIVVQIEPEEAAANAVLEINGIEYDSSELIELPSGEHSFFVQSEGYETARLLHTIESEEVYTVKVTLDALEPVNIAFFTEELEGSLFLNAIPQGELPNTLSLNTENILGEFFSTDENSTYFYLNAEDIRESTLATLSVRITPNKNDLATEIEKRRKGMYTAYGALLISLPITYLALGTFINAHNNYALGYDTAEERAKWQQVYDISSGVSIGCGIILAVQLTRYLWAANKVIPKQITPSSIKIDY